MTLESYLPPDVEASRASAIVPCDENVAQKVAWIPTRWLLAAGMILLGIGGVLELSNLASADAFSDHLLALVLLVSAGLCLAGEWFASAEHIQRQLSLSRHVYPDADPAHFARLMLYRPQLARDGRRKRLDIGFLTMDGPYLYWEGVWFQIRFHRDDITRMEFDITDTGIQMGVAPKALSDIRRVVIYTRPLGRRRNGLAAGRAIRAWRANEPPVT